jgi:hypothetical protein
VLQKRMYKVISPMEGRDGAKWWMRCGSGFTNKDDSINIYLNALPLTSKDGQVTLQLRELSEEDLRQNAEKRAQHPSPRSLTAGGVGSAARRVQDSIPF